MSDPDVDVEADAAAADAAMREAMGFGSFATRRPKNPSEISLLPHASTTATTQPSQSPSTSTTAETSFHFRHGDDNADVDTYPPTQPQQTRSSVSNHATGANASSVGPTPAYAFSAPSTDTHYTRAELDEWARGRPNRHGDLVFFKPGFVCDDPWARHRDGKDVGSGGGDRKGKGNERT